MTVFNPGKIAEAAIQIEELIKHLKSIKFLGGQILEIAEERRDSLIKILSKVNLFLSEKNANDFVEDCVSVYKPDLIKPVIDCTDKIIIESEQLLYHYDEGIKLVGKKFNNKSLLHEYLLRLLSFKNKKYKDSLNLKRKIVNCLNCVKKDIVSLRRMGFVEIQNANFSKQKTLLQITEDIKTKLVGIKNVNAKIKSIENFYHFLDSINKEIELTQTSNIFIYKSKTIEEFTSFEEMTKFYNDLYLKVSQSSDILMQNFLEQKDEKAQEYKNNLLSLYTNEIQCAKKCEELELFNFAPSDPVQGNITINNFCIEINNLFDRAEKTKLKIARIDDINRKLENYEQKFSEIKKNGLFFDELVGYRNFNNFNQVNGQYTNLLEVISSLDNHIDSYESYHNWRFFELKRTETELRMIAALKNSPTEKWGNLFKAWYYKGALINFENNSKVGFNKTNTKLEQLTILYRELKEQQLKQIKSAWQNQRRSKLAALSFNFNALYNLRKNKSFNRRNSLRKIIETDFNLFTTLFPVILTNPVAANAILPLKQGLFEIVIFDEASQLRIADTFTSLIRGQYKIIAGDEHQMPPSSYFQSSGEILDSPDQDTENDDDEEETVFSKEDEQAVLAESESLLEYGKDLRGINKSYLDFHYRSKHPALIDFSNCAFYGGNLIPFPAREVYKPIEFRAVNGRYDSRVNQKEVIEVLKILQNEIHPDHKGKYPSVGIATFNINQRNLITEAINEAAENDSSFAQKMQELKERGLFVKNLENIQGDERDIIIISTTYGIKPDGKFSQNFARLNRIEGYKLLNVLITRAKNKLYVCTSIPKEKYISYSDIVQNEGNNKKGILYAYLAYAEAISNNDIDSAESILNVLKEKSYEPPRIMSSNQGLSESVFEEEVYEELLEHFKKEQIVQQYKVGGFRLDFVVKNKSFDIVLECDGKAYHQTDEAYAYDMFRQKELEDMGFIVYRIWSTNWFQDKEHEMQKFLNFVKDKEECPARKL